MNKSVFGLLSLLLLLIIACIYQKTERLYALSHPIEIQQKPINQEVKALEDTKIASIKTATIVNTTKVEKVIQKKAITIKKEIIQEKETIQEKEIIQENNKTSTLLEEIKSSVTHFLSTTKDKYITPSQSQEIISKTLTQLENKKENTVLTSVKDKDKEEIATYILSVLNERDKALERRDEVMKALDKMLEEALYNQRIAIENMNNIFIEIETTQKRLIKERDEVSQINTKQEKGQ